MRWHLWAGHLYARHRSIGAVRLQLRTGRRLRVFGPAACFSDESEAESEAVPLTEDQIKEKMAVQAESAQTSAQEKKKKHQNRNSAHGASKSKPAAWVARDSKSLSRRVASFGVLSTVVMSDFPYA